MKQTTINRNNKQQGYTIVEILIGVIVAAIVLAGIYAGWNSFYSSNQASTINSDVTQIIQNTETLYAKSPNGYTDFDMADAIAASVFPSSMSINATDAKVFNSYHGEITITATTGGSGFTITYPSIPQDVCVKVLTTISSTNLTEVTVGGTSFWTVGSTWPAPAAIVAACTTTSTNTIVFTAS